MHLRITVSGTRYRGIGKLIMRYFITASDDASIYQSYPDFNTGFDEILEIGKVQNFDTYGVASAGTFYNSSSVRALVNFDLSGITYTTGSKYYLNLKLASAKEVNKGQQLIIGLMNEPWVEGSGFFYQEPANRSDGATWESASLTSAWTTASLVPSPTASYVASSFPLGDLRVDVTNLIDPMVSSSASMYGLYIRFPAADENSSLNSGRLAYFSTQTHTIYQPTLEVCYLSQQFVTGTLVPVVDIADIHIGSSNIKAEYERGTLSKIRLSARDKFPTRRFDSLLRYGNKYYLPSESYFRVKDVQADVAIGAFDQYSAIQCDGTSSYFVLDTARLYVNREYQIETKIVLSGMIEYIPLTTKFFIT